VRAREDTSEQQAKREPACESEKKRSRTAEAATLVMPAVKAGC